MKVITKKQITTNIELSEAEVAILTGLLQNVGYIYKDAAPEILSFSEQLVNQLIESSEK